MKKYIAECIGTFTLVVLGCGTAMLVGCDASKGCGYLLTALAFGLALIVMAYSIGTVSGCHINPAVSLAVFLRRQLSPTDLFFYILAQCLGGFLGSFFLATIFRLGNVKDATGCLGANGLAGVNNQSTPGLFVEILLTFFFVFTVLGVTSKNSNTGALSGVIIGLSLTAVHIFGISLTGTSVNPARSLGPAILAAIQGNSAPLSCGWVFVCGPVMGACLATLFFSFLERRKKTPAQEDAQSLCKPE